MRKETGALLSASEISYLLEKHLREPVRLRVTFPAMRNPLPTKEITAVSKIRRRVMCRFYDLCLETAIRRNWFGFSCSCCGSYEPELRPVESWQEQAERSGDILHQIFFAAHPAAPRKGPRKEPGRSLPKPTRKARPKYDRAEAEARYAEYYKNSIPPGMEEIIENTFNNPLFEHDPLFG